MKNADKDNLIKAAMIAKEFSQARYSKFKVGAALLSAKDHIITGCNIESSSYSLTICAERVALSKALSEGITEFTAIAIVAKDGEYCPPCGACRQLLYDYAPNLDIILYNGRQSVTYKLADLIPHAFEDSQLG